jgi:abscisic-aldehyde oxidase
MFKTFRASPRPLGNALAYVNAAFFARVSTPKEEGNNPTQNVIEEGRFAFGAFGTKHAIRAHGVEKFLSHKAVTPSVVLEALQLLKIDVVPSTETSKAEYRVSVAVAFLFEFLRPFLGAAAMTIPKVS